MRGRAASRSWRLGSQPGTWELAKVACPFQAVEGDWAAGRQGIAAGPLNSSTTDLGTYTLLPFLNEMMPSGVF